MLMLVDIEPGPARRAIGYCCNRCGHEVLFGNDANKEELAIMAGTTLDTDSDGMDHIHVGAHSTVGMGSVVVRDVEPRSTVMGIPARVKP